MDGTETVHVMMDPDPGGPKTDSQHCFHDKEKSATRFLFS